MVTTNNNLVLVHRGEPDKSQITEIGPEERWLEIMQSLTLCEVLMLKKEIIAFVFSVNDSDVNPMLPALVRELNFLAGRITRVHLSGESEGSNSTIFSVKTGCCRIVKDDESTTNIRLSFSTIGQIDPTVTSQKDGWLWADFKVRKGAIKALDDYFKS